MADNNAIFIIVENGQFVEYERLGSCSMCGQCCCQKTIKAKFASALLNDRNRPSIPKNSEKKQEEDWSDWEGWSARSQYGLWWWWKLMPIEQGETCRSYLNGRCAVWGRDNSPAICRDWPFHPDNLEHFPDCGFHFEKVSR